MFRQRNFFSGDQARSIESAIRKAELHTSGEIRVHVENNCRGNVMDCAANVFARLKMHKTKLRNGVLIYLAVKDKTFAIIGDQGINKVVPANFWEETKNKMEAHFREGKFTEGLCEGVGSAGDQLKKYFPRNGQDKNELPDKISLGK